MNTTLWRKIPPDVMINHIMPYSYRIIDANLLFDIRSFIHDYRIIINYYYFDMNEYVLLNDLILFCKKNYYYNKMSNMHSKITHILSLLTPDERAEFISQHIV